ncbi:MAG: acyl carrier protein [Clostridia bacterium]|nr:acyl carrier protein [Clostridia bacterium]
MVFEKVRAILSEQFDKSEEEITLDTNLFDDLEADSLDLADLLSSLEDEFDIEATDDVISSVSTVGDVVNYICEVTKLS